MSTPVHDICNHLAVVIASIEAFVDGKLDPTPQRLKAILDSLRSIDELLDDLPGA